MFIGTLLIIATAIIVNVVWLHRLIKEGDTQLATTNAMCDASFAFWDWRCRNQGVYIGLSPEGQALLIRYIRAYDEWLITHSFSDRSHYEWLVSLFNDFPPKDPHSMPPAVQKKPCDTIKGLFYFYEKTVRLIQ